MGPKSENVEKPHVFVCFFEGQRSDGYSKELLHTSGRSVFDVEKRCSGSRTAVSGPETGEQDFLITKIS